jgi:lysozyme
VKTSQVGLALIKEFEGLRLTTYRCSGGKLTIGYGHTGPDVREDMTITHARAEELLSNDVAKAEGVVNRYGLSLTQPQFDALVSFVYNLGPLNFATSTLLRRLRTGQYKQAADEFPRWINASGKPETGLIRRRAAERSVFLGGTSEDKAS